MVPRRYLYLIFIGFILIFNSGCEKLFNSPPLAAIECAPDYGDLETVFIFDASGSYDEETEGWRLKVRWDADDNGSWDSEFSIEKQFGYQFHSEGMHIVRLEVLDSNGGLSQTVDTVIVAPIRKDSVMIDPRDGREYKIVRMYGNWWMAENLKYGVRVNPGEFCRDNGVSEYYGMIDTISGEVLGEYYYTWKEASDYYRKSVQGICPDGWHIIDTRDLNYLDRLLAKISGKNTFFGQDGVLGLNFALDGRYYWPGDQWNDINQRGYYWLAEEMPFTRFSAWVYNNGRDTFVARNDYRGVAWTNRWQNEWRDFTFEKIAMPVRCVKNY